MRAQSLRLISLCKHSLLHWHKLTRFQSSLSKIQVFCPSYSDRKLFLSFPKVVKSQQTVVNQHYYVTWNRQNRCLLTKSSLDFAAERLLRSVDSVLVQSFKISHRIKFQTKQRLLPTQEVYKSFLNKCFSYILFYCLGFLCFMFRMYKESRARKNND